MSRANWTPKFRDLLQPLSPELVQEFDGLAAYLKGQFATIGESSPKTSQESESGLDDHTTAPPPQPDNPDAPDEGVRWLSGPWLLNADGAAPGKASLMPPAITGDVNDYAPDGIDSAIMLELNATQAVSITGIKIRARQRRWLILHNRSGFTISLVNRDTGSRNVHQFSWGTSGDTGEELGIPTNQFVFLFYDAQEQKWNLFGIPAVGSDNIPPSLVPAVPVFPPNYTSWYSHCSRSAVNGIVGVGENSPGTSGTATLVTEAEGHGVNCATAATTGEVAGIGPNATLGSDVEPRMLPTWTVILRTGADLTNIRYWIVLSSSTPTNADDLGANGIGFRYSSVVPDGGWVGYVRNSGTGASSVTATLASIAVSTLYKLKVRVASSSSIFFSVNDSAEVELTGANIPADTTALNLYVYVRTNANEAKSLRWFRHSMKLLGSAYAAD